MDEERRDGSGVPPVAPDDLLRGGSASFASRVNLWMEDARVEDSASNRARERWLHSAAEADASFNGVLMDLAERRTAVSLTTAGGRRHHGIITVVGTDFVALRLAQDGEVLLTLSAIAVMRTAPLVDAAVGERLVLTHLRLTEVIGELASERCRAQLVARGATEAVAGELRSVGQDVVTLRTDGDPSGMAYLPLRAIAEVRL